jgi:SAM-dependent methyltransferase
VNDTCPICGAESEAMLHGTPYRHCEACGTAFQSPRRSAWHSDRTPPGAGSPTSMPPADREVNRQLAQWLLANALGGKPARSIDLGCGFPFLARSLADLGCEAFGYDIDPVAAAGGRELGVEVKAGDLEHSTYPRFSPWAAAAGSSSSR